MSWQDVYRSFDDDSLATLANAGLLRRAIKDVEAGKVGWQDQAGGVLLADGQAVRLDGGGPQKGRCDCPAPGICKHIVAASLWLRALPADETDQAAAVPDTITVLDEVLGLDGALLCKQAGRPAARQALAWVADSAEAQVQVIGGRLQIELPALKLACSYLRGAGFEGMVSETPAGIRKALHLYALACVWRAHGRELPWPAGLDSAAVEAPAGLDNAELLFVAQVQRLLGELYGNGLSHVSAMSSGMLGALNMSARAENLPRLGAMLRTLGGTLDLLVQRDYQASERQAFEEMATIHALCAALAQATGEPLQRLRGRTRRRYDALQGGQGEALELLPLGAYWWQTRGGARGLTLSFWDHADARIVQAVLARPDGSDRSFNRESAWSAVSLWPGAGSAQQLCQQGVRLSGAALSDDGRLAQGAQVQASSLPLWTLDDQRWQQLGFADWSQLAAFLAQGVGLAAEPLDCIVLRPSAVSAPQIDEVRQLLVWQLFDASGAPWTLNVPALEEQRARITRLQQAVGDGADIRAVLARRDRDDAALWQPVSLLIAKNGALRIVSLDFEIDAGRLPSALSRFFKSLAGSKKAAMVSTLPSATRQVLAAVLDRLVLQARSGRPRLEAELAAELARHGASLRALGLDVPAAMLDDYLARPAATQAMRLAHVCGTCLALAQAA